MNQIRTSYKASKALNEFLGESAPEPIIPAYYYESKKGFGISATREYSGSPAAYQLHDLVRYPFCEAISIKVKNKIPGEISKEIWKAYWLGGMEAVEKALTEMMEGK